MSCYVVTDVTSDNTHVHTLSDDDGGDAVARTHSRSYIDSQTSTTRHSHRQPVAVC